MNASKTTTALEDKKVRLSTLWIFAMFNYLYADVYGLYFNPVLRRELTQELLAGTVGSIQITEGFVLVTAAPHGNG